MFQFSAHFQIYLVKNDPTRERLITFFGQFGKVEIFLKGEIDMFCRIVRDQPPIKFVTLSKKIIKRANELVYIGKYNFGSKNYAFV